MKKFQKNDFASLLKAKNESLEFVEFVASDILWRACTRNLIASNCLITQEPFDRVKGASMGAFLLKKWFIIIINNFSNQSYLVYGNIDSISILSKFLSTLKTLDVVVMESGIWNTDYF